MLTQQADPLGEDLDDAAAAAHAARGNGRGVNGKLDAAEGRGGEHRAAACH